MSGPALVVPKLHPGCITCSKLLKEWIALTEPAAEGYDREKANLLSESIENHYPKR